MSSSPAATTGAPAGAEPSTAIAKRAEERTPISMGDRGVKLSSLADAYRFAEAVAKSGLAPKGLDTPEKVLVALQFGAEAGLAPMASIRSVVVINGMPSWKGDIALALVRQSGLLLSYERGYRGQGDDKTAFVTTHRKGDEKPWTTDFSVKDAKTAGLWGKQGPWTNYPNRMLHYRALGFNLRDQFPEVLGGLPITEEADDIPTSIAAPAPLAAPPAPPGPSKADPLLDGVETPAAVEPAPEASTAPLVDPATCSHSTIPPSRLADVPKDQTIACPDCGMEFQGEARMPGEDDDEPTPQEAIRALAQAAAPEPARTTKPTGRAKSRSLLDDEA